MILRSILIPLVSPRLVRIRVCLKPIVPGTVSKGAPPPLAPICHFPRKKQGRFSGSAWTVPLSISRLFPPSLPDHHRRLSYLYSGTLALNLLQGDQPSWLLSWCMLRIHKLLLFSSITSLIKTKNAAGKNAIASCSLFSDKCSAYQAPLIVGLPPNTIQKTLCSRATKHVLATAAPGTLRATTSLSHPSTTGKSAMFT